MPETLTPHDRRRVAVEAGCDPRTVTKFLAGGHVVSTVDARILRALEALGFSAVRRGPVAP